MVDTPPHLGPELRQLAQTVLTILLPLLGTASATDGVPGPCQQVWCPVCAIAAVAAGQPHPLVTLVADLLQAVAGTDRQEPPPAAAAPEPTSRYETIPVTVHD